MQRWWPRSATTADRHPEEQHDVPELDEEIVYELRDGVGWITLNRPDRANALAPDHRNRIISLLEAATADLSVRVVVIHAIGKHFCTGADLRSDRGDDDR